MIDKEPVSERNIAELNPAILKAFVFDVDDTLVRGVMDVKDNAWRAIFSEDKEKLERTLKIFDSEMKYDAGDGEKTYKGDRLDIIAFMLDKWDPVDNSYRENEEVLKIAGQFKAITDKMTRETGVHEDDLTALQTLKEKFPQAKFYVVSNVPITVVQENMEAMGVDHLFDDIFGTPVEGRDAPVSKLEALQKISSDLDCEVSEILMVGDGNIDRDAARRGGTQFVGISTDRNSGREGWEKDAGFAQTPNIALLLGILDRVS